MLAYTVDLNLSSCHLHGCFLLNTPQMHINFPSLQATDIIQIIRIIIIIIIQQTKDMYAKCKCSTV